MIIDVQTIGVIVRGSRRHLAGEIAGNVQVIVGIQAIGFVAAGRRHLAGEVAVNRHVIVGIQTVGFITGNRRDRAREIAVDDQVSFRIIIVEIPAVVFCDAPDLVIRSIRHAGKQTPGIVAGGHRDGAGQDIRDVGGNNTWTRAHGWHADHQVVDRTQAIGPALRCRYRDGAGKLAANGEIIRGKHAHGKMLARSRDLAGEIIPDGQLLHGLIV